ncbi:MAG: hypothetical protein P1U36_07635 [Legionellaceae bacterium]|nr:hypothetical protein [Legionellaceae bacterium]
MPSNNQEPFVASQVSYVSESEIERPSIPLSHDVADDLEAQLEAIGEIKPSKIMGDMKPSISELATLYQEKKSRIDRFVEWYSNKSWSDKLWLGGAVASTSFVVGSLLGMTWLLTGLITGLYATAISMVEEHAKITRNRDAFTGEGAEKIEALIDEHVKSFQALEAQLKTVFESLSEQHTQRAESISTLEAHIDNVGEYNQRYASIVLLLESTSKKLLEHQEGVALTEAELHALYAEIQRSFDRVHAFSVTLSDVVSSVEQELKHRVTEAVPEKTVEESSVNATIKRSDKVIGDSRQALSKLREAAKARKYANAAQEKVYVCASASYNMQ